MLENIEIHGAVYNHPSKGHDRLFIDVDHSFAGVFDGAGGAELSSAIMWELPSTITRAIDTHASSGAAFLTNVVVAADNLPVAVHRKSTATIARVEQQDDRLCATYVNAGDSRLYLYDYAAKHLTLLAHTPTTHVKSRGRTYIDTAAFLGNNRSAEDVEPLLGQLSLATTTDWSIIGLTDGVMDDDGRGIKPRKLEKILRSTASSEVPAAVLDSVKKYDDASIFIMSHYIS